MKRKLVFSLLIVLTICIITGCGNNKVSSDTSSNNSNEDMKDKLIINGYDLTLDEESSFSKIKFKYPKDAIISNPITSLTIDYKKPDSDESVVRVIMGEAYGTDVDKFMNGFTKEGTKTINGIEWGIYKANGSTNYAFNINYNNIVVGFIYDDSNLSKFEEEFMNNVTLIKGES